MEIDRILGLLTTRIKLEEYLVGVPAWLVQLVEKISSAKLTVFPSSLLF